MYHERTQSGAQTLQLVGVKLLAAQLGRHRNAQMPILSLTFADLGGQLYRQRADDAIARGDLFNIQVLMEVIHQNLLPGKPFNGARMTADKVVSHGWVSLGCKKSRSASWRRLTGKWRAENFSPQAVGATPAARHSENLWCIQCEMHTGRLRLSSYQSAAMPATTNNQSYAALPDPMTLLSQAWPEVSVAAQEVGIDIDAMRHELPAPGTLLKGGRVPVLHQGYQHTCSVLLHINRLPSGDRWPFIRFSTFKHGGLQRDFNGLRWWREFGKRLRDDRVVLPRQQVDVQSAARAAAALQQENAWRLARFQCWDQRWPLAEPLMPGHHWLIQRFNQQADSRLLERVSLRYWPDHNGQTLMAPLEDASHARRGYQLITQDRLNPVGDIKRTCIPYAGDSVGSFVRILASEASQNVGQQLVAICEGLATGLSLALAWPGEIRVALTAGNLAAVREGIAGPVVFFCDDDIWKPHVGNVGRDKAMAAMRFGDVVHGPGFHPLSLASQPTDYNDLLWLEGREALGQQVGLAWSRRP